MAFPFQSRVLAQCALTRPEAFASGPYKPPMTPATIRKQTVVPPPPKMDCSGELLTPIEQKLWFAGCVFVKSIGKILTPDGHYMNEAVFNATYGGKKFIVDEMAKVANNAWAAATMSSLGV